MGISLNNQDSIARYCPLKVLSEDKTRILATAFHLRSGEPDLSVFWLEFYNKGSESLNIDALKLDFPKALTPSKSSKFGVLGVGEAKRRVQDILSVNLEFQKTPRNDSSHASIFGLACNEHDLIANELAEIANSRNFYPAL